jgi:superfamily II DNA helicase RecQ
MFGDPIILGLTATSTSKSRKDIFSMFSITKEILIDDTCLAIRKNIKIYISKSVQVSETASCKTARLGVTDDFMGKVHRGRSESVAFWLH